MRSVTLDNEIRISGFLLEDQGYRYFCPNLRLTLPIATFNTGFLPNQSPQSILILSHHKAQI